MTETKIPTTPAAHYTDNHEADGDDCGCWLPGGRLLVRCNKCKVDYLTEFVIEFAVFRCYDCGSAIFMPGMILEPSMIIDTDKLKSQLEGQP